MADQVGKYHDNGQPAYYIEEGTNKPYTMGMVNGQPTGKKVYLSPMAMDGYAPGPAKGGFFKSREMWDASKGEMERKTNWGNIGALAVGGAIAAPFVAPAVSGFLGGGVAPGGAGAVSGGAGASGAATGAAGGTLAATGSAALPAGLVAGGTAPAVSGIAASSAIPALTVGGTHAATSGIGGSSVMGGFLNNLMPSGSDMLKGVGSYLQGRSQSKDNAQARADALLMNQQRRDDDMRQLMATFLQGQQTQKLNATQMDPYHQAKSLNGMNIRRSFDPSAGAGSNFDRSAMDPSYLAGQNAGFQGIVNDDETKKKIMDYLSSIGTPGQAVRR